MRKFLIVGCGGSGGATLRYLMDQLRADLRARGIAKLPAAWQFLSIDVPIDPESTPGLGTIRDLGGRYVSVSSPGNNYQLVANSVEQMLASQGALKQLIGWAPEPKESCTVPVTHGAGQYRAIGRMLTMTDIRDLQSEFSRAWEALQSTGAWGELPTAYPEEASSEPDSPVVPIVVASMAGGSGAAMFLDVCRLIGRLAGVNVGNLGVFLYTADVFSSLSASERKGVDANALAAIAEIVAAQSRSSDAADDALFAALGVPSDPLREPAFGRVFPIGSAIGGDGARFGDGSAEGVFRGLARALAATMTSEQATFQYVKSKVENPSPTETSRTSLAWGSDTAANTWGSYGYASLSLGRDRYAHYASQRLARLAVDRLGSGFLNPSSQLPATEQLNAIVDAQFTTSLNRLGFASDDVDVRSWFVSRALPEATLTAEARLAIGEAVTAVTNTEPGQARAWVDAVSVRLPHFQAGAGERLREAAYFWANGWAATLERLALEEFLENATRLGLPYAVAVMARLRNHLNPVIDRLRAAPPMGDPLRLDPDIGSRAAALKKTVVGASHALADLVTHGYLESARGALEREAARLGAEVLASYCQDVLGGLERAGILALQNLEAAQQTTLSEAGLAQLETTIYSEWPEGGIVPARFDHAENEVLLTTAAEFPQQFASDVEESVTSAPNFADALASIVSEVVIGRWETTGGIRGDFPVLTQRNSWRPGCLPRDPSTGTPTAKSQPVYDLAVSTRDLLDRARAYFNRPDQPFERFSSQTIEEYLSDVNASDATRSARAEELIRKFQDTLQLARPLVGVSAAMVQAIHAPNTLTYQYSFSSIPLGRAVTDRLRSLLLNSHALDETTINRFDRSIDAGGFASKIAVYGSYPKYSPLVFSSLLDQIQKRWSSSPENSLNELWKWKRTRPLAAALAMGEGERRAMVMGWFLGRLLGCVSLPASAAAREPAQVWSVEHSQWRAFPRRLLTPPGQFQSSNDWLPAILESHVLALVTCNGDVTLGGLAPYVALRGIWDDSPDEPSGSYRELAGMRLLTDWVATGIWPSGRPSEISVVAAAGDSPADRVECSYRWLDLVASFIGENFLTDGTGVGAFAERRIRIDSVAALVNAPLFAEVAELAMSAVQELRARVDEAAQVASQQRDDRSGGGYDAGIM